MMGMEAALSDQLKAGGSRVGAVAGAGAESQSKSTLMRLNHSDCGRFA